MMSEEVRIAFEQQVLLLALNDILPSKVLAPRLKETTKYKRIVASVAQLGLIEPLSVARQKGGRYLLLDGHVRFDALRAQGASQARCVVAEDDEAFTYNKRINRLSAIQEHYMIVRALERGVPEEKLARALSVDVKVIRQRRHLLCGISSEVAELLKDRPVGHHAFQKLRKMKPIRQLEVAELMVSLLVAWHGALLGRLTHDGFEWRWKSAPQRTAARSRDGARQAARLRRVAATGRLARTDPASTR
jgi:RepB plasmid partitioning protein/ParB-like nuclease domain